MLKARSAASRQKSNFEIYSRLSQIYNFRVLSFATLSHFLLNSFFPDKGCYVIIPERSKIYVRSLFWSPDDAIYGINHKDFQVPALEC